MSAVADSDKLVITICNRIARVEFGYRSSTRVDRHRQTVTGSVNQYCCRHARSIIRRYSVNLHWIVVLIEWPSRLYQYRRLIIMIMIMMSAPFK